MGLDASAKIYRIAYISRCIVHLSDLDLADLEHRSARNNQIQDVTGLLLFDGARKWCL